MMHLQERRQKAISNALNKQCTNVEYWFNEVDTMIEFDLHHCTSDPQKAQVVIDWVRLCESLSCQTVKEEIMKRYNK